MIFGCRIVNFELRRKKKETKIENAVNETVITL